MKKYLFYLLVLYINGYCAFLDCVGRYIFYEQQKTKLKSIWNKPRVSHLLYVYILLFVLFKKYLCALKNKVCVLKINISVNAACV